MTAPMLVFTAQVWIRHARKSLVNNTSSVAQQWNLVSPLKLTSL